MTASTGAVVKFDRRSDTLERFTAWEQIVTFSIISGDTTGLATIPINGLLQKIIVKITDFTTGDGSVDVALQHRRRRRQVVLVILFENRQSFGIVE